MSTISKSSGKLKFKPVEPITMVNRDFGLMRVFKDRSATPYPRHSKGVDAEVLRQRLSYQQRNSGASKINVLSDEKWGGQLPRDTYSPPSVHIAISTVRPTPESLLRGTPHPRKGKAIDPKLLIKNLEKPSVNIISSQQKPQRRSFGSSALSSARSSVNHPVAVGTPHPKKRVVLNPKNLMRRLTLAKSDEAVHSLVVKKKVVVISPIPSIISWPNSFKVSENLGHRRSDSSLKRDSGLSFEERRRLFHLGEYTIAKNGKKLCDWPLSGEMQPIEVRDSLLAEAEKANEAIEKFIRKQGIFKAAHNTVTLAGMRTRMSNRRASDDSIASHYSVKRESENPSIASTRSSSKSPSKKGQSWKRNTSERPRNS